MYSINKSAHPEDVDNRISLLRSHGLTNISKITQRDVALLFGIKFMQSIFYVYSMSIDDSEGLIVSDSMFAATDELKEQTVKMQISFAVNVFKLRLLLDYIGPPFNSG